VIYLYQYFTLLAYLQYQLNLYVMILLNQQVRAYLIKYGLDQNDENSPILLLK